MYELVRLTEHDYYVDCPAKIGIVVSDSGDAVLIDSGSDKDAGKKVFRILESSGWKLNAILNTHSHADHIGGNRFLQEKTGCAVYAMGIEQAYARTTLLEPISLYGGRPLPELKNKFLLASECDVQLLTHEVLSQGMTILELPGHSFDMVGFLTADGTAYIADCVSSEQTLKKYGIRYLWNVQQAVGTLKYVKTLKAARFVPAHAPVTEDIADLAEVNLQEIFRVRETILLLCKNPITFEKLLQEVFAEYKMEMNLQQYALIGSTLRSYLTGLYEEGLIGFFFDERLMLWQTK